MAAFPILYQREPRWKSCASCWHIERRLSPRNLKLSLGQLPDRHCPHLAVAANLVAPTPTQHRELQDSGVTLMSCYADYVRHHLDAQSCSLVSQHWSIWCECSLRNPLELVLKHKSRDDSPNWPINSSQAFCSRPRSVLLTGGRTKSDGQMKLCYD